MTNSEAEDLKWMRRAILLSRRGFPAPNPHVGCVLVREGAMLAEGWHRYRGVDHAEAMAVKRLRGRAEGATAYVSLEPCNHQGLTGPCSEALISAGVHRVVFACRDPNPKAQGGAARLKEAGVIVESGLLEGEAYQANRQFLLSQELARPVVTLKAALSADGFMGRVGEQVWITGPEALRAAHRLRAECGAVLVGRGTVETDDPKLTARISGVHNQPVRVVLDPEGKLNAREQQVFAQPGETLLVTLEGKGGDICLANFDLLSLLGKLFEGGLRGLLVEGGPKTLQSFWKAGLADGIELFVAPQKLGNGIRWEATQEILSGGAPGYRKLPSRRRGADRQLSFRREGT